MSEGVELVEGRKFLLCKLHLLQSADHRWYKSRRLEYFGISVCFDTSGSLLLYEEGSFVPGRGLGPDTVFLDCQDPNIFLRFIMHD